MTNEGGTNGLHMILICLSIYITKKPNGPERLWRVHSCINKAVFIALVGLTTLVRV